MIVYDFEVFKHDWLVCYLDLDTRKMHTIINSKSEFEQMYEKYKDTVWIGYNSRGYDQWIAKAILCDFNPYEMSKFIIEDGRKGFEFSKLLYKFPINNYDTSVGFRSLKELEGFMGHDIKESDVDFMVDRPLTEDEIAETVEYCKHDVMETFEVFVEASGTYETMVGLLREFKLDISYISKTETQLAAIILGASQKKRNDEHDIQFSEHIKLDKYSYVKDWFVQRANDKTDFKDHLDCMIAGVKTRFAWGGVHGAKPKYIGEGFFVLSDLNSMYPSMMIEYDLVSRNVLSPQKYKEIYDKRFSLKAIMDPKEKNYKLVLNKAYGGMLDKYNAMYDPRNGRSVCVNGQLALTSLIERIEGLCEIININTDGVLVKLESEAHFPAYKKICDDWEKESRLGLGHDLISKVIQRDVNNAMFVHRDGKVKAIGAVVKKLSRLDNDLPIVNHAVRDFFINGTPVERTILECDELIKFQKITRIGKMYEYMFKEDATGTLHKYEKPKQKQKVRKKIVVQKWFIMEDDSKYGSIINTRVNRVFASKRKSDGMLMKKKAEKTSLDKVASTPDHCVLLNGNVLDMNVPEWLDKTWYIKLAKERINDFLGK